MRAALLAPLLLAAACAPTAVPAASDGRAPDFALEDVNPASATYAQQLSPRAERGRVSAWYFGHST